MQPLLWKMGSFLGYVYAAFTSPIIYEQFGGPNLFALHPAIVRFIAPCWCCCAFALQIYVFECLNLSNFAVIVGGAFALLRL